MPCVRIEPIAAECRIFYEDEPELYADYDLSLNIVWIPIEENAVFISMHVAQRPHTRETLRELVKALYEAGVRVVYATRKEGHVLPRAEEVSKGTWRLELSKVLNRI